MRYDRATDKYVPCEWDEAFAAIGAELKALDPKSVVFYASGRASLETSYLYALFARIYGHNNLPDSSNMCHETTSVGLKKVIGVAVGTVVYDDLRPMRRDLLLRPEPRIEQSRASCIRCRMPPDAACKIVTFNPVREKGLDQFHQSAEPVADADRHGDPASHASIIRSGPAATSPR